MHESVYMQSAMSDLVWLLPSSTSECTSRHIRGHRGSSLAMGTWLLLSPRFM